MVNSINFLVCVFGVECEKFSTFYCYVQPAKIRAWAAFPTNSCFYLLSPPHVLLEHHTISWETHDNDNANANTTKKKVNRSCMHTSIFILLLANSPFLSSWILRITLHSRTPLPCLITSFGCLPDVGISFADGTTLYLSREVLLLARAYVKRCDVCVCVCVRRGW